MESRIYPIQEEALIVVQKPGIHVPRTLKMKACLYMYIGGNFRKNIAKNRFSDLIRDYSMTNKRYVSDFFFCRCLLLSLLARLASLDAKNID